VHALDHRLNPVTQNGVNMNGADIVTLIGSLGFPIVMCLIMFKYLMDESENHKSETNLLKDTIQKNTEAIIKLKNAITGGVDNDD
jgi:hypothetical protein